MKTRLEKWLRFLALFWLLGYLFMIVGCGDFKGACTTPIVYELSGMASPMNEFSTLDTPSHKKVPHEGVYVGDVSHRGEQWRQYHFPNILEPPQRVLEILVRGDANEKIVIREAPRIAPGTQRALLFDHCFCGTCVAGIQYRAHELYTNALGSKNYISSHLKALGGNHYSGGFTTADISLQWVQRSRGAYFRMLARMLYAVPLDFIILPAQIVFFGLYSV